MYRTGYPHPIAYTYEAAEHCPACTFARFGGEGDFPAEDLRDSEGNGIGAVAPWDENEYDLHCDDCGGYIAAGYGEDDDV